jgi:prepilin-type processing-associated H-X9-DG protein
VLILPQLEQTAMYNSLNFSITESNEGSGLAQATAWYTKVSAFTCPSDGQNVGVLQANTITGQYPMYGPPPQPGTGALGVMGVNYHMSHGDNYTIGMLSNNGVNPWETPCSGPPAGLPAIGIAGFWGTTYDCPIANTGVGIMRGFSDYRTGQYATIASVTDGTSNTLFAGESLPAEDANNEFFTATAASLGITIPLNWSSKRTVCNDGGSFFNTIDWGCRGSYAAHGFKSRHPGGVNFLFADGSVHFLKNSINRYTIAALGSRAGGEVVSSDAY